jgi:hypothetical protein
VKAGPSEHSDYAMPMSVNGKSLPLHNSGAFKISLCFIQMGREPVKSDYFGPLSYGSPPTARRKMSAGSWSARSDAQATNWSGRTRMADAL